MTRSHAPRLLLAISVTLIAGCSSMGSVSKDPTDGNPSSLASAEITSELASSATIRVGLEIAPGGYNAATWRSIGAMPITS